MPLVKAFANNRPRVHHQQTFLYFISRSCGQYHFQGCVHTTPPRIYISSAGLTYTARLPFQHKEPLAIPQYWFKILLDISIHTYHTQNNGEASIAMNDKRC